MGQFFSHSEQVNVLAPLACLAEQTFSYQADFRAKGFKSFLANVEYDFSYCKEEELENHRDFVVEVAKRRICSPSGLIRRNDEPVNWQECDPCYRRWKQEAKVSPTLYQERLRMWRSKFSEYRKEELEIFRRSRSECIAEAQPSTYADIFESRLKKFFAPLGFYPDEFRSRRNFPVVSKNLVPGWDMCCSPETNRTLLIHPPSSAQGNFISSEFELCFYVRAAKKGGFLILEPKATTSNFLMVRLYSLIQDFKNAYIKFSSLEELDLLFSAFASLYELVGQQAEQILQRQLSLFGNTLTDQQVWDD